MLGCMGGVGPVQPLAYSNSFVGGAGSVDGRDWRETKEDVLRSCVGVSDPGLPCFRCLLI